MNMEPAIAAFLAAAKAQEGLPYTWPCEANNWSGKGYGYAEFREGRDCSGLVAVSLRAAGDSVDRRNWNAERFHKELQHTDKAQPGDLVVYVLDGKAVHIEIVMEDGRYFGAIGGGQAQITPTDAKAKKAFVKYREHPRPADQGTPVFIRNPLRVAQIP